MEILLLVVCVLIASADGFVAIYSALRRTVWKKRNTVFEQNYPQHVSIRALDILDEDILRGLFAGRSQLSYPKAVCDNGGRTGRGNPHLTRNRYVDISSIDTQIERIIRQAYD